MEFRTPTVQYKKNPRARISVVGAILLVVSVFLAMVDGYEILAMWTFGVSFLIFLVGAFWAKGDLTNVEVAEAIPLVVSNEGIKIGEDVYKLGLVSNVDFNIEGFAGMGIVKGGLPSGAESDGMNNYLRFDYMGEEIKCNFYLGGPAQAQQLGMLFKSFYEQCIPFAERKGTYPTYMFQPVSDKELEGIKRGFGYV